LRGRRPLQVGIPLLAVGLVLLIAGIVVVVTNSLGKVDGFDRVPIASGTGTATFDNPGGYLAYYEAPGLDVDKESPPEVAVRLTSPSGKSMILTTLYGGGRTTIKRLTYDYHGHNGAAFYQFHIDETGTYQVKIIAPPGLPSGATMAFGKSIAAGTVAGGLLVLFGILLLVAGLVLLIVGLVKRSRHKRELRNPPQFYAGPPPGYAGPPPGYGGSPPTYGGGPQPS
jgi:uncharacterized membrane protein YphA (DoxX/SURF4 family)